MTVYVDSANRPYRGMIMSHMMADTTGQLQNMAHAIGVSSQHIQKEGEPDEHFDVCRAMRRKAVKYGAREVETKELIRMVRRRRLDDRHQGDAHEEKAPEATTGTNQRSQG